MMLRPPLRFLGLVVGGWIAARSAWLLPVALADLPSVLTLLLPPAEAQSIDPAPARALLVRAPVTALSRASVEPITPPAAAPAVHRTLLDDDDADRIGSELLLYANASGRLRYTRVGPFQAADPSPDPAVRRLTGYAYLYARPGSGGATLGPGGQLGASQAGMRVAYAIDRHVAIAARVSTPLDDVAGAEAAAGIDLAVAKGARISVERRFALGEKGRNAWSVYAAGGFYEGLGHGLEIDGYAQAGVVGTRRRDLFADGALRGGRRLGLDAERALILGGGAWGAAQPGAARLDVGPRAALAMPLGRLVTTLALEGRIRVAGKAQPGSGVALTLAADF